MIVRISCLAVWLVFLSVAGSWGGDWPQILGPSRNGIAHDEKIATHWSAGGPKTLWQRPVGSGFAGVAVAGGNLVLFHRVDDQEVVECLDAATGKPLWKKGFPTRYAGGYVADNGPRCVPVVDQDRVFVYGAEGGLHCLAMADGKTLWSRAANKEFNAPDGYFGAGSTPIVEGDKLLVNIGGDRSGACIVAFSKATGETLWKTGDDQASYSSPVAVTVDGVRHVIFVTRLNCMSIDPVNGQIRFRFPFGARGPTVNGASPAVFDGHIFLTASYNVGAVLAKIGRQNADIVWRNQEEPMSSQYTTPIYYNGHLYGIDGRQDIGVASLRSIEPKSGKVLWTQENFGKATLLLADGKLLAQKTDGDLVLLDASPAAYRELAAARVCSSTTRALPALASGLYYVRDEERLKCLDLR
jgi:outer membrane protein assembly factor BamB